MTKKIIADKKLTAPNKRELIQQMLQLGLSHHQNGQLRESKTVYEDILRLEPKHFDATHLLGVIALTANQPNTAVLLISKALEIRKTKDAFFNYGLALQANRQPLLAIDAYKKAIALNPKEDKYYWNKALSLLQTGNFVEGWPLYEFGWKGSKQRGIELNTNKPLWLGSEELNGKTILLHSEQGLGDTIQFCRYATLVKEMGANVLLSIPKELVSLMTRLSGVDEVLVQGDSLPTFEYHCPLLSLPQAFKTTIKTIPKKHSYLQAEILKIDIWKSRLGVKNKKRIGLVWSGSSAHKKDTTRSLTLQELLPFLPKDYEYVSLQKEVRESDKDVLATSGIKHFGEQLKDFTDTAALCELMDIVISVDTSVAHLAGALGKTTWIMLPYSPDWRWLLDRDDSPWYPTVKLYRQDKIGDWSAVLKKMKSDLIHLA